MTAVADSADRVLMIHGRKERTEAGRCATCLLSSWGESLPAAEDEREVVFFFLSFVPLSVARPRCVRRSGCIRLRACSFKIAFISAGVAPRDPKKTH